MMLDVAVVGAGPSGLLAAAEATHNDYEVLVLEEHKEVGVPDHCAGLLSISGLNTLGLSPPSSVIQNTVEGARIFSPSGHSLEIKRGRREALVIDRKLFDQWLADQARKRGVDVRTSAHVRNISHDGESYRLNLRGSHEEVYSRFACVAEGSRCQISSQLGFPSVPRSSKYPAYQFEVEGVDIVPNHVEMFYGREVSAGFFGWIIPIGDGRARIGLASKDTAKPRLERAIRKHPLISSRMKRAKIRRGFGGIVLVGTPIEKTAIGNAIVTGDAAGHVKATTGGGVILGGIAARMGGKVIRRKLFEDVADTGLGEYDQLWRAELSKDFLAMFVAQKFLSSLSDKGMDSLIRDVSDFGLLNIVEGAGDMDRQRKVIMELAKSPYTYIAGLRALRFLSPLM